MTNLLTSTEIADTVVSLPGWGGDAQALRCRYTAPDFPAAIALVDLVAVAAEAAGHHPDIDIRWRDVLFVHAGPVPFQDLDRFERSADRLWIRDGFFASPEPFPDAESWATYRRAGISQVVFGHTPVDRPTLSHDGHALNLDTWRGQQVTLARLEPGPDLRNAAFRAEPVEPRAIADDPVSAEEIRRFDADLPALVDAWVAVHRPSSVERR